MKTAEELYNSHRPRTHISINPPMYFNDFEKAIAEDRKQITDKIKEMIINNLARGEQEALAEILNFIGDKQ